jgi:sirohydrochlorin cobaltochelatase
VKEIERLFESLRTEERTSRIGELEISVVDGGFVLYHRDDVGRNDLTLYELDHAFEIAKFDDAGNYRALKTAPNLRHGWKILARDVSQLGQVIDAIYPGRLAVMHAFKSGQLAITPLRETLNRQSGMYRIARKISELELDVLVGNFCRSDGGCLRTILWKRDAGDKIASSRLPPEKFDPTTDQYVSAQKPRPTTAATVSLPLLCQEACNLLVAACREKVKMEGISPSAP